MKCSGRIFMGMVTIITLQRTVSPVSRFYRQLTVTGRPLEIPLNKHFTHKIGNKSRLFPFHNQNLVKGLRPAMRLNILYRLIYLHRIKKKFKNKLFQVSVAMVSQAKNKFPILNRNSKFNKIRRITSCFQ